MIKLRQNNKAFTLVELLAVFIILGIIATIAIVSLRGIKVDYEKSTYEESVKGLLTAAQQKYAEEGYTGMNASGYGVGEINVENSRQYVSGTIKLVGDKLTAVNVSNGSFCANGPIDDLMIIEGECPSTDVSCFTYKVKSSGVTITGIDFNRAECVGDVVVPSFIEDEPVVDIGYAAFADIGSRYNPPKTPAPESNLEENAILPGFLPNDNGQVDIANMEYYYRAGDALPYYKGYSYYDGRINNQENWTWYTFGDKAKAITSVSLPISIVKIDDYAFANSGISSINLASLVNLRTIGDSAFGFTNLTTAKLSNCTSLQSIGLYAFYGSLLEKIDLTNMTSLKYIKVGAFEWNYIDKVSFRGTDKLVHIGEAAFIHNEITDVYVNNLTKLTYLGIHSFCDNRFNPLDVDLSNLYGVLDERQLGEACLLEEEK